MRFPDYDGANLPSIPDSITLYRAEHPDFAITGSGLFVETYNAQQRQFASAQLPRAERYPKYLDAPYKIARMDHIAINEGLVKALTTKFAKPTFLKLHNFKTISGFLRTLLKTVFKSGQTQVNFAQNFLNLMRLNP